MLSSMSGAHGHDTPDLTKHDLTDEAIETLYEIVRRAQLSSSGQPSHPSDPNPPSSRALFAAYEEVLEEQGLTSSDDAVLHRFLFRMQENRRRDEDLIQRFKRVLAEFGIDVEIDEDGEGIEVTTNLDATRNTRNRTQSGLGRHSRRGSFDSFFDGTADKVAGTDYGELPPRTRRGSHGPLNGYGDKWNQRRTKSDIEAHSYQQAQIPIRNKTKGNTHRRSISGQQQPLRKRSVSVSSRGSIQIRRDGQRGTSRAGDEDADDSESTDRTTSLDLSHVQIPGLNAPIPAEKYQSPYQQHYVPEPWQPSDTRLMDEAETFEQQRLHRVARNYLQIWRSRTQERRSIRDDMEQLAIAFDRRILLRLSFEQLRDTLRMRRSTKETNRFFTRLESRADKARNLFLLTKAFTHWAKSAEDEVQRTSVARRHILRTRFFNGWRDITAVNELKIQHFVLGKFLRNWRARAATVSENSQFAVLLYEENLVRRVYKEWFFKFCAIAAPAWRNDRTRRVTLQKWSEILKVLRERNDWAADRRDRTVLRKSFQTWQQNTAKVQALEPRADAFRQTALLSSALRTLQKQAQLAPLLRQFQALANSRLVQTAFRTWRHTSQLSRQACSIDRLRILRNAYTAWNDRLRIQALEDRINDRVIVECLYKWTLASRVSLFLRVHDRQLKESAFLTWVTNMNQRTNTLDAAERKFAQFKRTQLLRVCLRKMEAITAERRAEEFAIASDYQQKLKLRIFEMLKGKQEHFQQLKQWSADARFYVLSKHTLKTWSEATQHARRNRRRETYAQVRRTLKMNLVRRVFESWRDKANHVAVQNHQANDILENRVLQSTGHFLHQWHDRAITLRQQDTQAINVYEYKLKTHYLRTWSHRLEALQTLESQAIALRQESTEIAAASALKKFGWRLWNIQRQEENARALYERNFEKHVRAMIRFWFEQTAERLAMRPLSPSPRSRSRGGPRDDDNDGQGDGNSDHGGGFAEYGDGDGGLDAAGDETRRLETWTAFDESALGLNNDLDLSLSMTPDYQRTSINPYALPPPSSSRPSLSQLPQSSKRPPPTRPNTYPQPQSALRPPPPTIFEDDHSDLDLGAQSTFWSGTPMPPPSAASKPGYLKTPSKRSVVRAKRPELPASPEKRVISPVKRNLGAMSAPPARTTMDTGFGGGGRGITSFERRLQQSGFGSSVAGRSAMARGRGGKGKSRVGFGDVSEIR
ncbi:Sfi1-domain-containing protein [Cucurbitaria berberidis CBS 394.84]|uniref:Sfi1-domain-containing protein n=1 Tax=Cucurbitaria berberidis CBS 394.84 TaxID=1168544 RepID=A0A9P4L6A8_9PLEO|nr:Sfi1-domain-containing protein [Cucurbitaria berberidis CBS 394.84]KAF1842873.1 Sfi1-domain-containing protein [Cucurbitaria berberidis CBS 394.84]